MPPPPQAPPPAPLSSLSLLSAHDIAQHRFATRWRGYPPQEVDRFLNLVAEQTERLVERIAGLELGLQQRDADLQQAHDRQVALQDACQAGDQQAAQIRQAAHRDAEACLAQAQKTATEMVQGAQQAASTLTEQIASLRQQRQQLLEDMRGIVSTHERLLDVMESSMPAPEVIGDPAVLVRLGAPPPPAAN